MKFYSVLFVCTANICRSPMAAALFKKKIAQLPDPRGWRIESAGTWPAEYEPAAALAVQVMQERGMDITGHRARAVTDKILRSANLILTMEKNHKEALQAEFPHLARRIFLIAEMVGKDFDIQDPYGKALSDFEETARELEKIIDEGFDRICSLASAQPENAVKG